MFDELVHGEDRGVSPVIGVILMVAITVILAAVIGTFVLNLGGSVQENVQAGATVQCDGGADEIKVTWTSNQNANSLEVTFDDGATTDSTTLNSVGESYTTTAFSDGASVDVTVTATDGERSTVITTKECEL